ncbi:putative Ribosomal protein L11 methyltransferase-related [Hibiscus syriacus]|uniref:Ribosomal protein L11 methyltransferase-related n=1 Tax=Hibiscus syriacus TaxID=106335 RepID=A0A6A2ZIM4_HIBSY|nr:putative Ribosomal protein L11 methyltransferase-related [Hibiscus syriacus]
MSSTTTAAAASTSATPTISDSTISIPVSNFLFGYLVSFLSHVWTLLSLLTFNPFANLTTNDFSGEIPSWTKEFFADFGSYSYPASVSQARLRVQENVISVMLGIMPRFLFSSSLVLCISCHLHLLG